MPNKDALIQHLQSGATTTCHAWSVTRKDGQAFGFTDHDTDLEFDGLVFRANSGLTASALQLSLGLSVDNTEVSGALSDDGVTETDLAAGRFDAAEVTTWLVNWTEPEERVVRFRGTFGEIQRSAGAFKVELRGMAEALNQKMGRVYQPNCAAILGDSECRFDLKNQDFFLEASIQTIGETGEMVIKSQPDYPDQWFQRGLATILSGRAKGLNGIVKFDRELDGNRRLTIWVPFALSPEIGDFIKLEAGCDKLVF